MFPHNLLLDFEGRRLQGRRPFAVWDCKAGGWEWSATVADFPFSPGRAEPLGEIRRALEWGRERFGPRGGAMGFFGYDFARLLEARAFGGGLGDEPESVARLVFYEEIGENLVDVGDQQRAGGAGALTHPFGAPSPPARKRAPAGRGPSHFGKTSRGTDMQPEARQTTSPPAQRAPASLVRRGATSPPLVGTKLTRDVPESSMSDEEYESGVARILEYIAAGDIYQANLTREFRAALPCPPAVLYERLTKHPMPFSALLEWDDMAIVCNSPERFLRVRDGIVSAEPIKGTAPRGANSKEDATIAAELSRSPKDRAENVMIVDLLRNDLGRVCEYGSVHVPELCAVRTFPTLHHLVSRVEGRLRAGCDAVDAFGAAFPCGSITGAPKIRAMQILDSLEPVPRGVAMGAIGYFGFDGDADWNVAIRTVKCVGGEALFHVGGGIVAGSTASAESREIGVKMQGIRGALGV